MQSPWVTFRVFSYKSGLDKQGLSYTSRGWRLTSAKLVNSKACWHQSSMPEMFLGFCLMVTRWLPALYALYLYISVSEGTEYEWAPLCVPIFLIRNEIFPRKFQQICLSYLIGPKWVPCPLLNHHWQIMTYVHEVRYIFSKYIAA